MKPQNEPPMLSVAIVGWLIGFVFWLRQAVSIVVIVVIVTTKKNFIYVG